MKIKTQVSISIIIFVILAVVILISFFSSNDQLHEIQKKQQIIDTIEKSSFELYYLENDYILHGGTRTVERWNAKYTELTGHLEELTLTDPSQQSVLNGMFKSHRDLNTSFSALVAVTGGVQGKEPISTSQELKEFAESTLTGQTQTLMSGSSELSQRLKAEAYEVEQRTNLVMSFSIAGLMVFVLLNYLVINRSVLRSISALQKGAQQIGTGDLDTKIETGTSDELGHLSSAITAMASSLKTVLASKYELEKEVADRKRAEVALLETTEYLKNLFDYANAPIITWDPGFHITRFNHAFEHLTGKSEKEVLGKTLDILFPDENHKAAMALIQNTLEGERWETVEIPILNTDGSTKTILWNSANVLDTEGKLTATIAQGVDITERKRAEEERKRSIEQFRTVMDSIDAFVYVVDMQTFEILFINKYGRDIWGEIEGKVCWQSIQSGQKGPCPFCTNDRLVDDNGNPTGIYNWEFQNTANGHWYDCRDVAIRWLDGRVVRLEIATDITKSTQIENELRESEQKFRDLFDNSSDGIIITEIETQHFIDSNKTVSRMLGYNSEEIKNLGIRDIHPEDSLSHVFEVFEKMVRGEITVAENIPVKRKDGTVFYADISVYPLSKSSKDYLVGVFRDITDRKKADELLKRFGKELEQQVKARTEELNTALDEKEMLLREIHHRVRNILQMALSTMKQERRREPDKRIQAALIRTENRMAAISFVFDRVYLSENLTRVKFGDIIRSLLSRLSGIYSIDQQRIHIAVHAQDLELGIDLAIPLTLIANELISNAIQHAFPEDRSGEITISACEKEEQIILVVKDTGAGMPAGIVPDLAVSTGFTQIRLLAEQTGGTLSQTSSRNGTTFSVAIPRSVELDKSGVKEV